MEIHFYEKPGCINNTKQKILLEENGHTVIAHSLLTTQWTPELLRSFFGVTPVSQWFNMAAPRIKSGEISPDDFDADTAIDAMLEEPLLIRRPLIEANGERACGFDNKLIHKLIAPDTSVANLQSCPNTSAPCD